MTFINMGFSMATHTNCICSVPFAPNMLCIRFACKFNWICAEYNDGMPIDNNDYLFVESSDLGDEIHINFFFHILFNTYSIALIWFDCGNLTTTT